MKCQIFLVLLLFLSIAPVSHADEYDIYVDGLYYNILSESERTVEVTRTDIPNNIEIPDIINYEGKTYSVTRIGENAFFGWWFGGDPSLPTVKIPTSVTSIGKSAFAQTNGLTSITIPNSVTNIEQGAFQQCYQLQSVAIPNSVTNIKDYVFAHCYSLKSVKIPASVTSIGKSAFARCESLNFITLPSSIANIGEEAFNGCNHLTSLTIPSSVTNIGRNAFTGCWRLTSVYCNWNKPISYWPDFNCCDVFDNTTLYVPLGCLDIYKAVAPWKYFVHIEVMTAAINNVNTDENTPVYIAVKKGILYINGRETHKEVTLYDMLGHIVYNGAGNTLPNLQAGLYIIRFGSRTEKIIL